MHTTVDNVRTLGELRRFIHQTLCEKENLLADRFTMTEVRLMRRNEPCGFQFCLRGPRSVRLAAIWAADQNVVYLYDARTTLGNLPAVVFHSSEPLADFGPGGGKICRSDPIVFEQHAFPTLPGLIDARVEAFDCE